jgi:cytochrome c peroxidase
LLAPNATPYALTLSRFFPRPALPLDNPLTEEGVALGRRLFFDPRLSVNNSQSCASCHQHAAAFTDGRAVSVGAEGQTGTRSAMPLFNLAWKSSFFWDGRAPTLREQVLMPIQNPIEMHETLTNLVVKLQARETEKEKRGKGEKEIRDLRTEESSPNASELGDRRVEREGEAAVS